MAARGVEHLPVDAGRRPQGPGQHVSDPEGLEQQLVLYWYQSHGRVVASEYWGKFYMVYDALRLNRTDAALVRITAPLYNGSEDEARAHALDFAKQITGDIEQIIPR